MKYTHSGKCGGLVHPKTRTCTKCHKTWGRLAFWFDPKGIRIIREPGDFKTYTKQEELSTIQSLIKTRILGGHQVVALTNLFEYPKQKWARGLIVLGIVGGLVYFIVWLIR